VTLPSSTRKCAGNSRLWQATRRRKRPIGQYQAVISRIVDALCLSFALSALNSKVQLPSAWDLFSPYFQYTHHLILDKVTALRENLWWFFGYLRVSGMPQLIERVMYRSSLNRKKTLHIPNNKELTRELHVLCETVLTFSNSSSTRPTSRMSLATSESSRSVTD
jgi:hypothetical protein